MRQFRNRAHPITNHKPKTMVLSSKSRLFPLLGMLQLLPFLIAFRNTTPAAVREQPLSEYTAEVVGASGRMGSFFLDRQQPQAVACPRETTPGSQTPEGCPIYVATPSYAYDRIFERTPESRRKDLVFAGNAGLPISDRFGNSTILVPHFSVLYSDQWKGDDEADTNETTSTSRRIQVNTDPSVSPPTYIYGRHAENVATFLEANGIATQIVPSFPEIKAYSGRKLLWASCFWLLCHTKFHSKVDGEPLTVGKVHKVRQGDLERLVDEMLPSLRDWLRDENGIFDASLERIIDRTTVLNYLRAYSESISGAVPSVDLAKKELFDRNVVFLQYPRECPFLEDEEDDECPLLRFEQEFHIQLLEEMGIDVYSIPDALD